MLISGLVIRIERSMGSSFPGRIRSWVVNAAHTEENLLLRQLENGCARIRKLVHPIIISFFETPVNHKFFGVRRLS